MRRLTDLLRFPVGTFRTAVLLAVAVVLTPIAGLLVVAAGPGEGAAEAATLTSLPGGRPRFVVSIMGGGFNAYWVRLAQYTFIAGPGGVGTVRQSYWMWHEAHFVGTAKRNKVGTGYVTRGCAAACAVRTPLGFQPGAPAMATLAGRYRFDRYGRLVVEWPGRRVEVWTVRAAGPRMTRLVLHHTTLGGLYGDGLGSTASFAAGASRDEVARADVTGVQRLASYGDRGRYPVRTSRWSTNVVAPLRRCGGTSACLFNTGPAWRSAIVVPSGLGRRAFWQHQLQGSDGDVGRCFGPGGGHTVALLQALDDTGHFAGFVGAEASFNGRSRHNAVVGQLVLT